MKVHLSDGKQAQAIKKEQIHFEQVTRLTEYKWVCDSQKELFVFKVEPRLGTLSMGRGETEYDAEHAMPIGIVKNKSINFVDIMLAIECTMNMDNLWDDKY